MSEKRISLDSSEMASQRNSLDLLDLGLYRNDSAEFDISKVPAEIRQKKEKADDIFTPKKRRRASSIKKLPIGDHVGEIDSLEIQQLKIELGPKEEILFIDRVSRLTNRNHMADCGLIVTSSFLLMMNTRYQNILTNGPIPIDKIEKISTSPETDNAVVLHLPDFQSELFLSTNKIELMMLLSERYAALKKKTIDVRFSNIIEFPVSVDTIFEFDFVPANEGVRMTLFIKGAPKK